MLLEETLQKFNLDHETEARVRKIIEEFDLEMKLVKKINPNSALDTPKGSPDRELAIQVYLGALANQALRDYYSYATFVINNQRQPKNFKNFLISAVTHSDDSISFERDGDYISLYQRHYKERHKKNN